MQISSNSLVIFIIHELLFAVVTHVTFTSALGDSISLLQIK